MPSLDCWATGALAKFEPATDRVRGSSTPDQPKCSTPHPRLSPPSTPAFTFDFAGRDFASPYVTLAAVTSLLTVGLLTDSLTLSCELLLSSSCLCSRLARMFAVLRTFALFRILPSRARLPPRKPN